MTCNVIGPRNLEQNDVHCCMILVFILGRVVSPLAGVNKSRGNKLELIISKFVVPV